MDRRLAPTNYEWRERAAFCPCRSRPVTRPEHRTGRRSRRVAGSEPSLRCWWRCPRPLIWITALASRPKLLAHIFAQLMNRLEHVLDRGAAAYYDMGVAAHPHPERQAFV